MENKIEEFVKKNEDDYGFVDGFGYGYGDGSGFGYGYGDGYGSGNAYGCGFTDGSVFGDGYGRGNDYGYGCGLGSGSGGSDGYGVGDGFDSSVYRFNNDKVYTIDGVPTIIRHIKGNIAKGYIVNGDFTLDKCYVVKDDNLLAHGKTLKEAIQSLNEKKWENLDTEEVIEEFCNKFEKGKLYKGTDFFDWHHYLTGSCLQGRESFCKNHGINLEDEFTVDEFIEATVNDYNGEVIKELKERWKLKWK